MIAILLVGLISASLFACTVTLGEGDRTDEDEENVEVENTGNLVLVKNGIPTFQFVAGRDLTTAAKNLITKTATKINSMLEKDAKLLSETADNKKEIEIFFGTPRYRDEEYRIDCHYLGPKGYAIRQVGRKIIVLYGSDDAIAPALNHLETVIFGITDETEKLKDVTVTDNMLIEKKQEFELKSLTVCGNDLRSYHIEYTPAAREFVGQIQNFFYTKAGIWLTYTDQASGKDAIIIREPDEESTNPDGLSIFVDENANLVIETEFPNKIIEIFTDFLAQTALVPGTIEYDYGRDIQYGTGDLRNIYYNDFGAVGDGVTDDFAAIKKCHDYANKYGHTVNATPGAIYYIGKNAAGSPAVIKTDVNWHGCYFIIDDRELRQPLTAEQNGGTAVLASPGWDSPIFSVERDTPASTLAGGSMPISYIYKGSANIGFSLGYKAMLVLYNDNVRHYIRYGLNANNGSSQHELIIVDEYGNVDPTTPIQWDYETVSSIIVYRIDDKPITISGGEFDEEAGIDNRTHFEQKYNVARSFYTYCFRNIQITRSNVILENITHEYTDYKTESEGGSGAPYSGFTSIRNCNNVTIRGIEFMNPPTYYLETQKSNNMGSYEISAGLANNVLYKNCTQSNFFEKDGSIIFHGLMGTNYCKNLTFEDMFVCSFDAHCGVYNATIRNSTAEHLNFIGDGDILLENVTIYADATKTAMNFRSDYGSTWAGNITINGLEMRYSNKLSSSAQLTIIKAAWNNHNFGYTVYYPQHMTINDLSTVRYTYGINSDGTRWENIEEATRNQRKIYLISTSVGNHRSDLSDPDATISGKKNINPVVPIGTVTINNFKYKNNPVNITLPTSTTFQYMSVIVDGKVTK